MDLQEGSLGLIRAAERFDHRRGARFGTYARWWINEVEDLALRRLRAIAQAERVSA